MCKVKEKIIKIGKESRHYEIAEYCRAEHKIIKKRDAAQNGGYK